MRAKIEEALPRKHRAEGKDRELKGRGRGKRRGRRKGKMKSGRTSNFKDLNLHETILVQGTGGIHVALFLAFIVSKASWASERVGMRLQNNMDVVFTPSHMRAHTHTPHATHTKPSHTPHTLTGSSARKKPKKGRKLLLSDDEESDQHTLTKSTPALPAHAHTPPCSYFFLQISKFTGELLSTERLSNSTNTPFIIIHNVIHIVSEYLVSMEVLHIG